MEIDRVALKKELEIIPGIGTNSDNNKPDSARQAIDPILSEIELSSNGTVTDFAFRQALASKLSAVTLRRFGLLKTLNFEFAGDIPMALAYWYSDIIRKPVLNLASINPSDLLQTTWLERAEAIEKNIRKRIYAEKARDLLIGRDGEPLTVVARRRRKKKPPKIFYTADKSWQRIWADQLGYQEDKDEDHIIDTFVKPGYTACKILGYYEKYDATVLLNLLNQVGSEGKVYYLSPITHLRERLFQTIFASVVNFSVLKGENNRKQLPNQRRLEHLLTTPYFTDLDFYQAGFSDPSVLRQLSEVFYQHCALVPLNYSIPPLPKDIPSRSIDVVLELDRFAWFENTKKEELLWEIDRVLKPGGSLLVRENSRAQAEIEYYGQGLLDKDYERWRTPRGTIHWARWMVLHKSEAQLFPQSERKNNLRTLTEEILLRQQSGEPISLRWFRERGLLSVLMSKFEGSIEKAREFALSHEQHSVKEKTQVLPESPKTESSLLVVPKDAKTFYDINDLAQELNLPRNTVRKALEHLGLKTLRRSSTGRPGHSGFSRQAVESRQFKFSYQEYIAIRDTLLTQNLKAGEQSKNGHNSKEI